MSKNKDRLLTSVIIILSIAGISYFGFNAFSGGSDTEQENPFEYNIDYYKQYDPALNHYQESRQISINLKKIIGIAIGPSDELYVSGDDVYLLLDEDNRILKTVNCGSEALCLDIDNNKDVYLGMTDHIQIFDQNGVQKSKWKAPGKKSIFTSVYVTSDYVYVADAGDLIVWQFDKSGNVIRQIGRKDKNKDIPGFIIPSPYFDLSVDPDGFLWVANTGRLSLENYTAEGDLRASWGISGMKIDQFCGCCNPSHFAIASDGSFVTGEKGIARVKVHNRLGKLVSVVAGPKQFNEGTVGIDIAIDSKDRIYVLDPMRKQVRVFEKKTDT
jgi:hypothetical protein